VKISANGKLHPTPPNGSGWGKLPAGYLYVAWHPKSPGYTKLGFTLWHPVDPCEKYPRGKKRLHDIDNYLEAFGFPGLEVQPFDFHPRAKLVESNLKRELAEFRRIDVGRNTEIFNIDHKMLIARVIEALDAQTH
jgi:hypothetical protein